MRTCIVDQNVDSAELLEHRIDEFLHRAFVGDVGWDTEHAALVRQFGYRGVKLRGIATANCNPAALLQQRLRHSFANTARCAGDHSDLAAKAKLHCTPRFLVALLPHAILYAAPEGVNGRVRWIWESKAAARSSPAEVAESVSRPQGNSSKKACAYSSPGAISRNSTRRVTIWPSAPEAKCTPWSPT